MNQEELRKQLIDIIESGLSARAIAEHSKITYDLLAKYKQGRLYLCPKDANRLKVYLDKVVIPK